MGRTAVETAIPSPYPTAVPGRSSANKTRRANPTSRMNVRSQERKPRLAVKA